MQTDRQRDRDDDQETPPFPQGGWERTHDRDWNHDHGGGGCRPVPYIDSVDVYCGPWCNGVEEAWQSIRARLIFIYTHSQESSRSTSQRQFMPRFVCSKTGFKSAVSVAIIASWRRASPLEKDHDFPSAVQTRSIFAWTMSWAFGTHCCSTRATETGGKGWHGSPWGTQKGLNVDVLKIQLC